METLRPRGRTQSDLGAAPDRPFWADQPHEPAGVRRVPVLLPYPLTGPFDYAVPPDLDPQPGDIVLVPLNRREEIGVVWDAPGTSVPPHKLKPMIGILDSAPIRAPLRRFIDWVAAYTLSPPGDVLAMALRVLSTHEARVLAYRRVEAPPPVRITPPRQRVLDVLAQREPVATADLAATAGVGAGVLRSM